MRSAKLSFKAGCLAALSSCLLAASHAGPPRESTFTKQKSEWTQWSPRKEIEPKFEISDKGGRQGESALSIVADEVSDFGAWKRRFPGITSGKNYKLEAWYKSDRSVHEQRSVAPRLEWLDGDGKSLRPPEYAIAVEERDGWKRVEIISPAPEKSAAAEVQLGFGFVKGSMLWDDISFGEESSARDRVVNVATVFHRPRKQSLPAKAWRSFAESRRKQLPRNRAIVRTSFACRKESQSWALERAITTLVKACLDRLRNDWGSWRRT